MFMNTPRKFDSVRNTVIETEHNVPCSSKEYQGFLSLWK